MFGSFPFKPFGLTTIKCVDLFGAKKSPNNNTVHVSWYGWKSTGKDIGTTPRTPCLTMDLTVQKAMNLNKHSDVVAAAVVGGGDCCC